MKKIYELNIKVLWVWLRENLDDTNNGSTNYNWAWTKDYKTPIAVIEKKWNLDLTRTEEDHNWTTSQVDKSRKARKSASGLNTRTRHTSWQIHLSFLDLCKYWCDVTAGRNIISPDHINMLAQARPILDRRLFRRPKISHTIKTEMDERDCSPELTPSPHLTSSSCRGQLVHRNTGLVTSKDSWLKWRIK